MNRANVLGQSGPLRRGEDRAGGLPPGLPGRSCQSCQDAQCPSPACSTTQGDVAQAITQERRALALCEQLPDPDDRAISHNNLCHLPRSAAAPPSALAESSATSLPPSFTGSSPGWGRTSRARCDNYAIRFRRAQAAGTAADRAPRGRTARRPRLPPSWTTGSASARPTWPRCRPLWIRR